jgi:hypothetical protein
MKQKVKMNRAKSENESAKSDSHLIEQRVQMNRARNENE